MPTATGSTKQPRRARTATPEQRPPATPQPDAPAATEQRILDALAAGGWLDIQAVHAALAAQPDGAVPHPEVKTTLRALVADERIQRGETIPPRWRTPAG